MLVTFSFLRCDVVRNNNVLICAIDLPFLAISFLIEAQVHLLLNGIHSTSSRALSLWEVWRRYISHVKFIDVVSASEI